MGTSFTSFTSSLRVRSFVDASIEVGVTLTSTDESSVGDALSSTRTSVVCPATTRIEGSRASRNPSRFAEILYSPGASDRTRNAPEESVVASCGEVPSLRLTLMVAPGTGLPLSLTATPATSPVVGRPCAFAIPAVKATSNSVHLLTDKTESIHISITKDVHSLGCVRAEWKGNLMFDIVSG
jgi:hypothetical protein